MMVGHRGPGGLVREEGVEVDEERAAPAPEELRPGPRPTAGAGVRAGKRMGRRTPGGGTWDLWTRPGSRLFLPVSLSSRLSACQCWGLSNHFPWRLMEDGGGRGRGKELAGWLTRSCWGVGALLPTAALAGPRPPPHPVCSDGASVTTRPHRNRSLHCCVIIKILRATSIPYQANYSDG